LKEHDIYIILLKYRKKNQLGFHIFSAIHKFIDNNRDLDDAIFEFFQKKDFPDILSYMYIVAFRDSKLIIFTHRRNLVARLFAMSRIDFKDLSNINKAISAANKNLKTNRDLAIRICINLIDNIYSDPNSINECYEILKNELLSVNGKEQIHVFNWILHAKNPYTLELIKHLIDENIDLVIRNINPLAEYLWLNKNNHMESISILYKLIEDHPDIDIQLFERYIKSLNNDLFTRLCSWILNNDNNNICLKIRVLSRIKLSSALKLNENYLKALDFYDLKYIAHKIIAFVISAENITSLIFSLLNSTNSKDKIDKLVENIFTEQIMLNYHYPVDFLNRKVEYGNNRESQVAKTILKKRKKITDGYQKVERIKELRLSGNYLRDFNKLRFGSIQEEEKNESFSPMSIFQNIQLKTGVKFTSRMDDGKYTPSSGMNEITSSFEIPQAEFLDPIGQSNLRLFASNYKREQ